MREIIAELDQRDPEHPDAWIEHESGWCLSVDEDDYVNWSSPDPDSTTRHMRGVARAKALDLWIKLSNGQIAEIDAEPWAEGFGQRIISQEERAETDSIFLAVKRQFFDSLGPERSDTKCEIEQCSRGRVTLSVYCRIHHYEAVQHEHCPFDDQ